MLFTPLLPNFRIFSTIRCRPCTALQAPYIFILYPHVNCAYDDISDPVLSSEQMPSQGSCDENLGPMLLAVSYVLLCTAITAVALRLYVKLGLRNGVKSDDYTIVASLVSPNLDKVSLLGDLG